MATPATVKVSNQGRITIPKALREGFCLDGDVLSIEPLANGLVLRRIEDTSGAVGEPNELRMDPAARPVPDVNERRIEMRKALLDSRAR